MATCSSHIATYLHLTLLFFSPNLFPYFLDNLSRLFSGYKVKETGKLGPRPEKPIEIYEFERYFVFLCRYFKNVRFTQFAFMHWTKQSMLGFTFGTPKPWFGQKLLEISFCPNHDLALQKQNQTCYQSLLPYFPEAKIDNYLSVLLIAHFWLSTCYSNE